MYLCFKILLICSFAIFCGNYKVRAQKKQFVMPSDTVLQKINAKPISRNNSKPKPLINEYSLGISFTNIGSYISFRKYKSDDNFELNKGFYVNIGQIKSEREISISGIKSSQDPGIGVSSFIYGKINNLLNIQTGYSISKRISGILENSNVIISGFGDFGLSIGYLKPYYLSIARSNASGYYGKDEKYSDSNAVQFLDKSYIYAKSPFSVGLSEGKFQLGVNSKVGLQFKYLPTRYAGILIEMGLMTDAFGAKQQILIGEKAKQFYPGAFAGIKYCIKSE
jgi:hypothetical protein